MITKIGKDVIESLTQAMYEDSRFIFREYIQNSADQIDKAVESGLFNNANEGQIYIEIDKANKRIIIEDNATGIKADDVLPILKNIAKSPKDRSKDKGFRGIGRLGGLAYCEKLVFETSTKGEIRKTIMTWDAKKLNEILNNRKTHEDASEVIDAIIDIEYMQEDISEHYFRVILNKVTDEYLLDKECIKTYLSMVAPVPYNNVCFKYAKTIYDYIHHNKYRLDEYVIYVNNDQIKKAYTNYIYNGTEGKKAKYDEILDIQFFDIKDKNSNNLAWGWYSISSFNGIIPEVNTARCIRLRKNNIQIGLEDCLENFHKEKRGNSYFFGEIHAIDPQLIPNSRRDYFVDNPTLYSFNEEISAFFKNKLYKYYHLASDIRSQLRAIQRTFELKVEFDEKAAKGYKSKDEKVKLEEMFDTNKDKAIKSERRLRKFANDFIDSSSPEKRILKSVIKKETESMLDSFGEKDDNIIDCIKKIVMIPNGSSKPNNSPSDLEVEQINIDDKNSKPVLITDKLDINKNQKKLLEKIILIIDNALPKDLSKSLIQKIIEELDEA